MPFKQTNQNLLQSQRWSSLFQILKIMQSTILHYWPKRMSNFEEIMEKQSSGTTTFSKIDLWSDYCQIHFRLENEWNTVYKMKKGWYDWLLILFKLPNIPNTFMWVVNHVLKQFIGKLKVVCFDDILTNWKSEEENLSHLRCILFWRKASWCEFKEIYFHANNLLFLYFLVSAEWIHVDGENKSY